MLKWWKKLNHSPTAWVLLILAGAMFHIVFQTWWHGVLIVVGAILIDIAVDMIFTQAEKKTGEIKGD